jgi:hypothetical protein
MTSKLAFPLTLAFASFVACATPNKYNPTDSSSEEPDGPAGPLPDGAVTPDRVASSDVGPGGDASMDEAESPSDAPVEPDGPRPDGPGLPSDGNAPPTDMKPLLPDTATSPPPTDACGSASDIHNCGSCGHDCTQLPNVKPGATVTCQSGHCSIPATSCTTGHGHCGSSPADNGCEIDISLPATCGCSACGSGQVCNASGSSYQCACGGATPDTCGATCINRQNNPQNCGTCGHSCLGGTCSNGKCQPVQIYNGTDLVPASFTVDGSYIYFKRQKAGNVTVLARMPVDGGQITDLTSVDEGEGSSRVALAGGKLFWAKGDALRGCSAPSCSGSFDVANQTMPELVTASADGSRLFWARRGAAPFTADIMTNPSNPTTQGSISNNPIFSAMSAFGSYAFVVADNTIYRVSGMTSEIKTVGDAGWGVAANGQSVFLLNEVSDGSKLAAVLVRYSVAAAGTAQNQTEVGRYLGFAGYFGLVADDSFAYWLIGSETENALRLLRCPVGGCGNSPTELAYTRVSFPDGWLVMNGPTLYWATQDGMFKLAK